MVRIKRSYPIQVCGHEDVPTGELPSDPQQTDRSPSRRRAMQKAPLAVHHRSACSGVKACPWLEQGALRNTSDAKAASRQALLAFRSLDPFRALREPDRRRRDEERLSRSEQRTTNKPKPPLDRKSPIQVRILLPPAGSLVRTWTSSIRAPKIAKRDDATWLHASGDQRGQRRPAQRLEPARDDTRTQYLP